MGLGRPREGVPDQEARTRFERQERDVLGGVPVAVVVDHHHDPTFIPLSTLLKEHTS